MTRIWMVIPDSELMEIDAVASPSRAAFMIAAAKEAVSRSHRDRSDAEIARCLAESACDDVGLAEEFAGTAADGM